MGFNGITPNAAVNAYTNSQGIGGSNAASTQIISGGDAAADNDGVSFSEFLKNNIEKSVETMKGGEEMSAKAITGDADLTDVVQAVTSAELTLQTVVAVRDRMISAYQEIMRMPI
tara:strand:- start:18170 stop:18514 length:345 start_codon:yes stop_codon:yes gene_type:complete